MSMGEALQAAIDARDLPAALELCSERLADAPEDADAHRALGLLRAAAGQRGPAMAAGRRACELSPDDPRAWSDLGRVHAMLGDLAGAAECFAEAVEIDVRYVDAWHNLGVALRKLGRREPAFRALKNALLLEPGRAGSCLALGGLLVETGQFEDALECFERAARLDPSLARARSRLADHLSRGGKVKRAETLFRQSLALDPDHVEGWLGLGRALEDLGEAESAEAAYLNVLLRRPSHAGALGSYLGLARGEEAPHWAAHAHAALREPSAPDEAKALIGYGLAKRHDRQGEFALATDAARLANAARRRIAGPLDRAELSARVDEIVAAYSADFFSARRSLGVGAEQPVFIVGLPRSGTTLTEQILAAHPQLHGAGEIPDLARIAARFAGEAGVAPWMAAFRLDEGRSLLCAGDYLKALRNGAPKRRLRISDKSPLNFFQLAFAAILFPGARVIHCRRSPRDNALSIWLENFGVEQRYATDFGDLAFFAAQYERLMAHWRRALPLRTLEVQYEQTVGDLEGQARRLIAFLGVPWDARCLQFHSSGRAVQTPSRWQVRQPIYSRSVDRWKAYADRLPELEAAFATHDGAE